DATQCGESCISRAMMMILCFLLLNSAVLSLAMAVELVLCKLRRSFEPSPHPVVLFGSLVSWMEKRLNRGSPAAKRTKGAIVWLVLVGGCALLGVLALWFLPLWAYIAVFALFSAILLAFSTLSQFVGRVADGLSMGLEPGREAVSHIVGRDPQALDEAGVARAAIESLAENFSDGVTAPLFWGLVGGLPGLLAYKAINTLDSMWGYRNERYEDFGKASARLDDAANWIPARLTGALVCLVSAGGWRAMVKGAPQHRSPNAGWPEAAFAASLDVALAGPRKYDTGWSTDPPMGSGRRSLTSGDITRALRLYFRSGLLMTALTGFSALVLWQAVCG
ncbi:MAG: adenosylcobinamide-phosphate synthase CbiB, partial [Alphaproteobacteria bacterium]